MIKIIIRRVKINNFLCFIEKKMFYCKVERGWRVGVLAWLVLSGIGV